MRANNIKLKWQKSPSCFHSDLRNLFQVKQVATMWDPTPFYQYILLIWGWKRGQSTIWFHKQNYETDSMYSQFQYTYLYLKKNENYDIKGNQHSPMKTGRTSEQSNRKSCAIGAWTVWIARHKIIPSCYSDLRLGAYICKSFKAKR